MSGIVTQSAILTAGYYDTTAIGGVRGEHTYCYVDAGGIRYGFPCFGGMATEPGEDGHTGVNYPRDMFQPIIGIITTNLGNSVQANLYRALGMAQFTADPADDYTMVGWQRRFANEGPDAGKICHAGIIYAVAGVCHQACNRIMRCALPKTPLNWPPSFNITRIAYGFFGDLTWPAAAALEALMTIRIAAAGVFGAGGAAESASAAAAEAPMVATARLLGENLRVGVDAEARERELAGMLAPSANTAERAEVADVDLAGAATIDRRFHETKRELDILLLRGEIGHDEYAETLNRAMNDLLTALREVLPPERFAALFPDLPEGTEYQLIDRRLMPDSYAEVQAIAKV